MGQFRDVPQVLSGLSGDAEAQKILNLSTRFAQLQGQLEHFKKQKDSENALRLIEEMIEAGVNRNLLSLEKM